MMKDASLFATSCWLNGILFLPLLQVQIEVKQNERAVIAIDDIRVTPGKCAPKRGLKSALLVPIGGNHFK